MKLYWHRNEEMNQQTTSMDFAGKGRERHPFHIVQPSPLPLIAGVGAFAFLYSMIRWFTGTKEYLTLMVPADVTPTSLALTCTGLIKYCLTSNLAIAVLTLVVVIYWWAESIKDEGLYYGYHTEKVKINLWMGFDCFIISETMFFASFFVGFLYFSLNPSVWIGNTWPPKGTVTINPYGLPLIGTIVLLSSSYFVVLEERGVATGARSEALWAALSVCVLGALFLKIQQLEWSFSPFTIADNIYGTFFFILTGLHGMHVFLGTCWLIWCLKRIYFFEFVKEDFMALEMAAIYWHFVDVVWIFLYLLVYQWGSR